MLTEVKNHIKVVLLSVKYNIVREMVNKVSFLLNIVMMMLNNASFIIQWVVYLSLKSSFGGYGMKEVMLLWGISSASFGLAHVFFGGFMDIPKLVENGGLDAYLVQPKNTLLLVLSSKSTISAIGDFLYGVIITLIFWPHPVKLLLFFFLIIISAIIYTAFTVIINSLSFWFLKSSDATDSIRSMYINFSIYPQTIFGDFIKIIMYTVIPAGIAVFLPSSIIIDFNFKYLVIVILFASFIVSLAFMIFNKGLKNYSSANLMNART